MKGSRAKKQAEEAAGGGAAPAPAPPKEPRAGPPRPGNGGKAPDPPEGYLLILVDVFEDLISSIRTNKLLGAAAADALEEAVGRRSRANSQQGKGAQELRGNVADSRDDVKPKKKMGGFAAEVEDIPDIPEKAEAFAKGRHSFLEAQADGAHTAETAEDRPEKDAPEPPELNLTPKQNHMRTDLEMWVMDEIPVLFGVDDSEDLDEALQEDGQALKITQLIAESSQEAQATLLNLWIADAPDAGAKAGFSEKLLADVAKIQDLGPKKKKKKKQT